MQLKKENLGNVCRVCLIDKDNLISILKIPSIISIDEQIERFSGLKILRIDGLPSSICDCCAQELATCYRFLEKCHTSEIKLQKILNNDSLDVVTEEDDIDKTIFKNIENEPPIDISAGDTSADEQTLVVLNKCTKTSQVCGNQKSALQQVAGSVKQHTCEVCGKSFSTSSNLRVHQRAHTGQLPYACSQCDRRFAQQGSLAAHARRHSGERPFRCALCPSSFTERTHLRRHASVHSQERPFVCAACGKAVKSSFALKQHAKLHAESKDHVCETCGTAFAVKGNLVAHIRARHSERAGRCGVCARLVADLSEHMPQHTGEKPHACADCGRRFSRRRGLLVHARRHTGSDKFPCPVGGCRRAFHAKWVLDCHILKHTGITPFLCKYCSKGFFRVCHMTKHIKLNHPYENGKNYST